MDKKSLHSVVVHLQIIGLHGAPQGTVDIQKSLEKPKDHVCPA